MYYPCNNQEHIRKGVTRVRACNYVKIEAGWNFRLVLQIVTHTVHSSVPRPFLCGRDKRREGNPDPSSVGGAREGRVTPPTQEGSGNQTTLHRQKLSLRCPPFVAHPSHQIN